VGDANERKAAGSPLAKALRYGGILLLAAAPVVASGEGFGARFAAAAGAGAAAFVLGAFLDRPRRR
jgi:hypothetical protein